MKLSLQPMENMQISVVALPGHVGPKRGILTISRLNSPSDKKIVGFSLPLLFNFKITISSLTNHSQYSLIGPV